MGGPGRRLGTEGGEKLECLSLSSSGGVTSAPLAPTAQVYPGSDSLQRLQLMSSVAPLFLVSVDWGDSGF